MEHKLKPTELTNKLLSESEFRWYPSDDRIMRFERFADNMKSRFAVVAWGENDADTNKAKIELFSLVAGNNVRKIISELLKEDENTTFEGMLKGTKQKLLKGMSPLLALSKTLSEQQQFGESFEDFYNRVVDSSTMVDWSNLTGDNIKNAIIATTLACRTNNPYVRGHCASIKDFNDINLDDILSTAHEFETKNIDAMFPNIGQTTGFSNYNPPKLRFGEPAKGETSLFGCPGAPAQGQGGGLFGCIPAPAQKSGGLFGGAQTGGFSFGAANNDNNSNTTGFGNAPSGNTFGRAECFGIASHNDNVSPEEQRFKQLSGSGSNLGGSDNTKIKSPFGFAPCKQKVKTPNLFLTDNSSTVTKVNKKRESCNMMTESPQDAKKVALSREADASDSKN